MMVTTHILNGSKKDILESVEICKANTSIMNIL